MWQRKLLGLSTLVFASGCGGDNPSGPPDAVLPGTWEATSAVFVSTESSETSVDIIPQGGSFTLVLEEGGAFTIDEVIPEVSTLHLTGTWSRPISSEILFTFETGLVGEWEFDIALDGNALTLLGGHAEYDFDDDGEPDSARFNLVLQRQ